MSPHDAGPSRDDLAALVQWYVDMGVDMALDEAPHDRFAEGVAAEAARATARSAAGDEPVGTPLRQAPAAFKPASTRAPGIDPASLGTDETARSARELAAACTSLDELRAALEQFDGCGLKRTASKLVFADGNPGARFMLIGEAPGGDEDKQGLPFVGKAGQLLDRMLAAIGLDRTKVYIANVVPWRPPGNRAPTPQETIVCLPFLLRQIALVDPDVLLCLGNASTQSLLGLKEGIMRTRGRWYDFNLDAGAAGAKVVKSFATLHPEYLLRSPGAKRLAWRDLREVKKLLDGLPARG
jgi:uracil-DNA glycosylase family 4